MWLLITAIAITFTYCFVIFMNLPKWFAIIILIGVAGFLLLGILIKIIWKKKRSYRSIQKIVEIDESNELLMSEIERDNSRKLKDKLIDTTKKIKNHPDLDNYKGDPIYALPWYLIIGESGTGKTTAIDSSGLGSKFSEFHRIEGSGGTKDCDWWIFDGTAIIIDTAGRFTINEDKERDTKDWETFLKHLRKYRKKEPVNGIIVCVSAEKLQNISQNNKSKLKKDAVNIRHRIKSVMEIVGAKFPIYILVTFCDKIKGFKTFTDLPGVNQEQALGNFNHEYKNTSIDNFVQETMKKITNRLKDLRKISILNAPKNLLRDLLLFPNEFEKLEGGLKIFLLEIFSTVHFSDPPILRGIYFSSSKQDGETYSHFLEALGIKDVGREKLFSKNALFLKDFFSKVLPFDRELHSPLKKHVNKSKGVKRLALIAYLFIGIFICGLLSISFFLNYNALNNAITPLKYSISIEKKLKTMNSYLENVITIEKQNQFGVLPRMGLHESENVEKNLKQRYCQDFKEYILKPFDRLLKDEMGLFNSQTDGIKAASFIFNVMRRIQLLQAFHEKHESFEKICEMPDLNYISEPESTDDFERNKLFTKLYRYYMIWNVSEENSNEIVDLRKLLKTTITDRLKNLKWLLECTNKKEDKKPKIRLSSFWKEYLLSDYNYKNFSILYSYTKEGYESMLSDIDSIKSVFIDEKTQNTIDFIKNQLFSCEGSYPELLEDNWKKYAENLMNFSKKIKYKDDWYNIKSIIGTEECPYLSFFKTMAGEFSPVIKDCQKPNQFLYLTVQLDKIINQAKQSLQRNKTGTPQNIIARGTKQAAGKTGRVVNNMINSKLNSLSAHYQNYLDELEIIRKRLTGMTGKVDKQSAYSLVKEVCQPGQVNKSPFTTAKQELTKLYESLISDNLYGSLISDNIVQDIIEKPLNDLWNIAVKETQCFFQEKWSESIISNSYSNIDHDNKLLCGDGGETKKFFNQYLDHFLVTKRSKGFSSKSCYNMETSILFEKTALDYILNCIRYEAKEPINCQVEIDCNWPKVNSGALRPHKVHLIISNKGTREFKLSFNGFPNQKVFNWDSSKAPYDVTIQIEVGQFSAKNALEIKYKNFQTFKNDFSSGSHTFYPSNFKGGKIPNILKIKHIIMKYKLSQSGVACINGFKKGMPNPGPPKEDLTTCW